MNTGKIQPTMFVFAGNNGSGKSTIRNLIAEKIGIGINIDSDSITRKYIVRKLGIHQAFR